jgi:hypothetical protein
MKHNTKYSKTPFTSRYRKTDIYQMKCMDCPLKYKGQTGQAFYMRYEEHIEKIRNGNGNSGYLDHILNTVHTWEYNQYIEHHKN